LLPLPAELRPDVALVVQGVRRSGKSTRLRQLIDRYRLDPARCLFVNFEDPRLASARAGVRVRRVIRGRASRPAALQPAETCRPPHREKMRGCPVLVAGAWPARFEARLPAGGNGGRRSELRKGVPDHIRSDNGSEFTAKRVREWLERVGVKTLSIEPGSPWENGHVKSFNGKLRDEPLAREVFDALLEAKVLIERWRKASNTVRPHSSPGVLAPRPQSRAAPVRLVRRSRTKRSALDMDE